MLLLSDCSLIMLQHGVALNLYDFIVRAPGRPAEKYGLRAYDEIILSVMVRIFTFNIPYYKF